MANSPLKLVTMPAKSTRDPSPLTPELKAFIDTAIVPALVKQYLAEADAENKLAKPAARVALSDSSTAVTLRVRP
jgi:hypothetical protein